MTPWLSIVGLGEDGLAGVAPAARPLIEGAETLVGGARHLAMVPADHPAERLTWANPLDRTVDEILRRRGSRVCVLATGDPMWYGIGVTLARHVAAGERTIVPAAAAFSLACARMGWPLAEVETLTLHGRPLDLLRACLAPGARLILLANDGDTPAQVAALLAETGYGESRVTVLEHMGGDAERRVEATAERWQEPRAAALNTLCVECRAGPDAKAYSRVPGLPDAAYENDGQITKREVRAATLAALAPLPGQLLWDVGAGAGSIAIEWMRAARGANAVAVERDAGRAATIARNAAALGAPDLEIVTADAPAALAGLDPPDAVFVGGGVSEPGLIAACWEALAPSGRLVANVVTVEGEAALLKWHERVGGELTRIAVSRTKPLGEFSGWTSLAPVTQ
ncbi:MAG: precorrin-6y C5,15-methyltransferase (decarboxylating) subunit CbiE, partial [Alphaproteobacteria bacterium]